MNSDDLQYIFCNIPYTEKNYYKNKIQYSPQKMYMTYLLNSNINYNISGNNQRRKNIEIFRLDGTLITTIKNPIYPTNSKVDLSIIRNKVNTEKHLKKFGINTPDSKIYNSKDKLVAKRETFKNGDRAMVIKPLNLSLGRGVVTNVKQDRFEYNWDLSRKLINYEDNDVIVQNFVKGFEVRATIMEGNLVSLIARIPPYIVGDGISSINDLIDSKNIDRENCNYLKTMLIKKSPNILEYLSSQSKSLDSIPDEGEYILLNSVSNTSYGGETINITNLVSDEIKDVALNAVAAIPDLYTAGVDIMIKSFNDSKPYVIEINTFPFIMLALYPTYGKSVNPAKHYLHSIISKDQLMNNYNDKYDIENESVYIRHYFNFLKRRINLYTSYIK